MRHEPRPYPVVGQARHHCMDMRTEKPVMGQTAVFLTKTEESGTNYLSRHEPIWISTESAQKINKMEMGDYFSKNG